MSMDPPRTGKFRPLDALDVSIDHTRKILFRPFDISVWICLGLMIFLDYLGQGGGSGLGNFPSNSPTGQGGDFSGDIRNFGEEAREFVGENLPLIIGVGSALLLFLIAITVLISWLSARGQMMFIRSVCTFDFGIGTNWKTVKPLANSLFLFKMVMAFIGFAFWIVMLVIAGIIGWDHLNRPVFDGWQLFNSLAPVLIVFLVFIGIMIPIQLLLRDFVAPVMYLRNLRCLDAWGVVIGLMRGNFLSLTIFYLIRFVISIVRGIAAMMVGCFTCFIGFLPVVHQALLAPLYVFDRSFSIFTLQTLGDEWVMIEPTKYEVDPFGEEQPRDLME